MIKARIHNFDFAYIDIAILSKIKHYASFQDVRRDILAMDDGLCRETFLSNLIAFAPSRVDNLVTMKKYLESPEEELQKLDLPEQFMLEVKLSWM